MCWPGRRLLAITHYRMADPGVSAHSLLPAVPGTSWQPDPAPKAGLPCGAAQAALTALSSSTATLVPDGGRQRVASGLREGHLQQGPAGTMAATTLPTTAAVQRYPGVEASPIPANDNMVLGETLALRGRGFTPPPGKHGLVSPCCQLTCCPSPPLQG